MVVQNEGKLIEYRERWEGVRVSLTSSVLVSHVIPVVYILDLEYLYCILVPPSEYTKFLIVLSPLSVGSSGFLPLFFYNELTINTLLSHSLIFRNLNDPEIMQPSIFSHRHHRFTTM
jgi:hypothetical protein